MKIPFAQFGDETPLGRQVRFLGEQLKKFSESQIDGFNVKSSFIGAGLAFSAQTATTPKVLSVSGVTADLLPSSIVYNNQDNTYTSGTQDFSLTNLIVPIHLDNRPPKKGEIWLHPGDGSLKIRDGRTSNNQTHNIEFQDNKGIPQGYPSLDINGDVPLNQMNPNVALTQGNLTWTGNHNFERASLVLPRKNYNPNAYQRGEVWINNGQKFFVSDEVVPNLHTVHDNKNTVTWDPSFTGISILGNTSSTLLIQPGANHNLVLTDQAGSTKLLLGTGGTVNFYGGSTLAGQINANGHWGIGTTNDDAAMFEINASTAGMYGLNVNSAAGATGTVHGINVTMANNSGASFGIYSTQATGGFSQAITGEVTNAAAIAANFLDNTSTGPRTTNVLVAQRNATWSAGGTDSTQVSSVLFNPTVSATATWSGTIQQISHIPNVTSGTYTASGSVLSITHAPTLSGVAVTDSTTGINVTMTPVASPGAITGIKCTMGSSSGSAAIGIISDVSASTAPTNPLKLALPTGVTAQPVWLGSTSQGANFGLYCVEQTITVSAATSANASRTIPANSIVCFVTGRVTSAFASATWGVDDGTTSGKYIANGQAKTLGTTAIGIVHLNPANTDAAGWRVTSTLTLRLLLSGLDSGVVRVTAWYMTASAATS